MSILDSLKHAAVSAGLAEDEPNAAPAPTPADDHTANSQPVITSPSPTGSLSALVGAATTSVSSAEADGIYQRLVEKTNLEKTAVYLTIQKYLAPLASLGLTPGQQFKAALNQAKAQEGITEESILGVFDTLKDTLSSVNNSLQAKAATFEQNEITVRQDRLSAIASQIQALQTEQTQVAAELTEAQNKSAATSAAVASAMTRRTTDIDGLKASYAALMQ